MESSNEITEFWNLPFTFHANQCLSGVHKEAGVYTFMRLFKVTSTRRTSFLITSHQIGKFCFSLFSIFQLNLIYTIEVITSMFIFFKIIFSSHVILTWAVTWKSRKKMVEIVTWVLTWECLIGMILVNFSHIVIYLELLLFKIKLKNYYKYVIKNDYVRLIMNWKKIWSP